MSQTGSGVRIRQATEVVNDLLESIGHDPIVAYRQHRPTSEVMDVQPQLNLVELAVAATIGSGGLNAVEGGWPAVALVAGVVLLGLSTLRHGER